MATSKLFGTSQTGGSNQISAQNNTFEFLRANEPELSEKLELAIKKYGIEAEYYNPNYMIGTFVGSTGMIGGQSVGNVQGTGQVSGQNTTPQTAAEIDTKLQIILNSIPIADPGKIITSEYHNSLRDAVRAIASRIGLSVNPVSEFKILSFAPNLIPLPPPSSTSGATTTKWDVFLNRASIPPSAITSQQTVSGGFVVQLPDGAKIFQMTVRGERLDKDAPKPTKFNVKLSRLKFSKDKLPPTVLIDIDLTKLTDGFFEEKGSVKLSNEELDSDTITAQNKIADRKLVNNETHLYYVSAEWLGGMIAGQANGAKSEIHSIQIYCAV